MSDPLTYGGPTAGKVVPRDELLRRVEIARQAGKCIVHCHGCFDIVHPGHVRYLEYARQQGDVLVVSLTGDALIDKGAQRPYIPEELRAENLAALQAVDLVYVNPETTACELLAALRPDIYVKGSEYQRSTDPGFTAERNVVTSYGGRVLFSSGDVVFSSTRLVSALGQDSAIEAERLALICRRHGIDRESISTLLERFRGLRVLVVGDVIMDRYVFCDASELASEAPMMSLSRLEDRTYVGGAGIVARHLAGLGASAHLLSAGADDELTASAIQTFAEESVAARLIRCRARLPEKTRYLVETVKVMRVEDAQTSPLDSRAEQEAADWIEALAGDLDAVIFCDFGYGTLTAGLLDRIRRLMAPRNPVVSADVSGPRGRLLQFRHPTLLCPTEREVRLALHDFERGLSNVAWNAMDLTQARHMFVTLGKKGLVVFDRQTQDPQAPEWRGRLRSEYLPSLAEQVTDTLGCGDALLATASLTLAAGGTSMQGAYLGSAAAAVSAARVGNVPIDAGVLRRWLSGRTELIGASIQTTRAAAGTPQLVTT